MSNIPETYDDYVMWILGGNQQFDNIVNHVGCDSEWLIRNISWLCNKRIVNKITHCIEDPVIGPHYNVFIHNAVATYSLHDRHTYDSLKAFIDRHWYRCVKTGLT